MIHTKIFEANLDLTLHSQAVLELLNAYASDPMGNGAPLEPDVLKELIPGLKQNSTSLIFIAFHENKAVGIAICFKGFSTFQARSMLMISDFFVYPEYRGLKIGQDLLEAVQDKAVELHCCKIILDVQENNFHAKKIYTAFGFTLETHAKNAGPAVLLSKVLSG